MKYVSIQQSLQYVADNPVVATDDMLNIPVHELVSRTLFEIANGGVLNKPRTLARANAARSELLLRLVGRRLAGSHPATRKTEALIQLKDLVGDGE